MHVYDYIDGHEQSDVLLFDYRNYALEMILLAHISCHFCKDEQAVIAFIGPQCKSVVLIFHDESSYFSFFEEGLDVGRERKQPMGVGQSIMLSDFVDKFNNLVRLTEEEFERGKLIYPDLKKTVTAQVLLK